MAGLFRTRSLLISLGAQGICGYRKKKNKFVFFAFLRLATALQHGALAFLTCRDLKSFVKTKKSWKKKTHHGAWSLRDHRCWFRRRKSASTPGASLPGCMAGRQPISTLCPVCLQFEEAQSRASALMSGSRNINPSQNGVAVGSRLTLLRTTQSLKLLTSLALSLSSCLNPSLKQNRRRGCRYLSKWTKGCHGAQIRNNLSHKLSHLLPQDRATQQKHRTRPHRRRGLHFESIERLFESEQNHCLGLLFALC